MSGSDSGNEHLNLENVDTGAEEKSTVGVNKLKKGGYCLIEGRPCRVVDIVKSKPGKHGHAKASITGTDLFTGKRYETHMPTSHEIEVPFVDRSEYELINIDDDYTQLLALDNTLREDVTLPKDPELRSRVQSMFEECSENAEKLIVTVLSCGSESLIIDVKKSQ